MNSRIDIIGTNGNDGEHYNNPKWNKPMIAEYSCGHEFFVLAGDELREACHEPGCKGLYVKARNTEMGINDKPQTMADRYPAYYKDVRHLDSVDVYRVHRLFDVTDNEIHHASKKLLLCGVRTGGKPARKEVEEARDTLNRWLEIQAEEERL